MLKRHVLYQIRKWLPLLLVCTLYSTFSTLIFGLVAGVANYTSDPSAPFANYQNNPIVLCLLAPSFFSVFILPFFVYSYRTSKKAADTFYQASYSDKTIKRARVLIGLGIVLVAVTVSFWIGALLYGVRYAVTPEQTAITYRLYSGEEATRYVVRSYVNLAYLPVVYLIGIVLYSAQYFINCFLVSLGNHLIDQICTLVFGNFILMGIVVIPNLYALSLAGMSGSAVSPILYRIFYYGLGPATPMVFLQVLVNPLLVGEGRNGLLEGAIPNLLIAISMYVVFAASLGVLTMTMKDPSGEYAGKAGARNKPIALVPHGAGLLAGIGFACSGLLGITGLAILPIFLFALFAVFYYIFLSLWRRNFKLNIFDWICFGSVSGFCLILTIIELATSVLRLSSIS